MLNECFHERGRLRQIRLDCVTCCVNNRYVAESINREELNEALRGQTEHMQSAMSHLIRESEDRQTERMLSAMSHLIRESEERQTELMRGIETKLLRSFHDYSKIADIRFRKLEANEGNSSKAVELRLAMIEAQLLEVQTRLIEGGL